MPWFSHPWSVALLLIQEPRRAGQRQGGGISGLISSGVGNAFLDGRVCRVHLGKFGVWATAAETRLIEARILRAEMPLHASGQGLEMAGSGDSDIRVLGDQRSRIHPGLKL